MQITLYRTLVDNNYVNKLNAGDYDSITAIEGTFRDEVDLLNPIFTIRYDPSTNTVFKFNYCYIPEFERYYFITSVKYVTSLIIELTCHVDVLMTYKDIIRNTSAVVDVSNNIVDYKLPDPNIIFTGENNITQRVVETYLFKQYTKDGTTVNPTSYIITGVDIKREGE